MKLLSDGGLCFGSDNAQDNALDDYEQGTWTPTLAASDLSVTWTPHSNNTGIYTKIGRMVYFQFNLRGTLDYGMATSHAEVTGLLSLMLRRATLAAVLMAP